MPSVFDTRFAASGFPVLLAQFGETVYYAPKSGATREIQAIVNRQPPGRYDADGNVILPKASIRVHNSSTLGISSEELKEGQDQIQLYRDIGDSGLTRFSIQVLNGQDSGVTDLALL